MSARFLNWNHFRTQYQSISIIIFLVFKIEINFVPNQLINLDAIFNLLVISEKKNCVNLLKLSTFVCLFFFKLLLLLFFSSGLLSICFLYVFFLFSSVNCNQISVEIDFDQGMRTQASEILKFMSISNRHLQHQSPIPSIWFLLYHFGIQQRILIWCHSIYLYKWNAEK